MTRAKCPECGRLISVYANKFGDLTYRHHKMAKPLAFWEELYWKPGVNPIAYPLWEIDCPNSGQAVDDTITP